MTRLTIKQKAFVEHYLITGNATEAARLAGYQGNDNTLASIGSENLTKPKIVDEIKERVNPLTMTADEVLERLSEQARADYAPYIKTMAGLPYVDIDALVSDGKTHLIKRIRKTKQGYEIEFYDAQSALGLMARHHGVLTPEGGDTNVNIAIAIKWPEEVSED